MARKDWGIAPYKTCMYKAGGEHLIPVPRAYSKPSAIRRYEEKDFCDNTCRSLHVHSITPDIYCDCGTIIPRFNSKGELLRPSKYKELKTCGAEKCVYASRKLGGLKSSKGTTPKGSFHADPDLMESWCLGGERKAPKNDKPITGLREMMNDIINRPWGRSKNERP